MIDYNFYPDKKLLFTIFYGEVSPYELSELIDKLQEIDMKEGGMRGLVVLCKNAKLKGIKTSDIMNAGERMHNVSFRKNGKNAIVAKSLLAYGLSRMYKVAADIFGLDEIKVYKEKGLNEAIEWLNINYMKEEIHRTINNLEVID